MNTIEDEFHFILESLLYQELRKKFINKYYWKRPNILKFIDLMTSESPKLIKSVSMFVFKSFVLRKTFILNNNLPTPSRFDNSN